MVDLADLVPSLKREVNPPGVNLYPTATGGEWLGHLRDAFWEGRMNGLFSGYEENAAARSGPNAFGEGIVTPLRAAESYDTAADLDPSFQQLIVLYAGYRITLTQFQNLNASFKATAGPVSFEQQKSASILKGILDALKARINTAVDNLSSSGAVGVVVFDSMIERTYSQAVGDSWYVR